MKLKVLIARLERIAAEHGDIDVACTENCGSVAEDVALSSNHLILPNHLRVPPHDVRYPYLLIGGTGINTTRRI